MASQTVASMEKITSIGLYGESCGHPSASFCFDHLHSYTQVAKAKTILCGHSNAFCFDRIFFILADNEMNASAWVSIPRPS